MRGKTEKLIFQATEQRASVIHLFVKMARRANEASNFVFVQLIEQEHSVYDRSHPDYARQDKVDRLGKKFVIK
jgi:hypothetical protein